MLKTVALIVVLSYGEGDTKDFTMGVFSSENLHTAISACEKVIPRAKVQLTGSLSGSGAGGADLKTVECIIIEGTDFST